MELTLAYRSRSAIHRSAAGLAVTLAPNLRRDRVSFAGVLRQPLRFREAVSALHDIVVSDLRYKPRDKSAYERYRAEQHERELAIRRGAMQGARAEFVGQRGEPVSKALEQDYRRLRKQYWDARQQYSNYLMRHDPELWRLLMPCDPVITVAPDVMFFECFSGDESSYGCLTVSREALDDQRDVTLGTTNVDYSWALYEHFQKLRTYRETRFLVDPTGFEVQTQAAEDHREETIDLPASWLRGFMQLQAAMSLPMRRISISRDGLYNTIAWLRRHRATKSPRALRFELEPGKPVALVLEPWEQRIVLYNTPHDGPRAETIRIWGRDRLRVLARLLPLLEGAEVYLLGAGLPSFWVVRMGEMRLILGLSGWTSNDWTGATALDQLAPPAAVDDAQLARIAAAFQAGPTQSLDRLRQTTQLAAPILAAGLNRLALMGQVIHDLPARLYRWRQIMPVALSMRQIGAESPETAAARELLPRVRISRDEPTPGGLRMLAGKVGDRPVELLLDADGRMVRGQCTCSHHFTGGLRKGPCRHLQAMRRVALGEQPPATLARWYEWLSNYSTQ
jgi:hypothetical protein